MKLSEKLRELRDATLMVDKHEGYSRDGLADAAELLEAEARPDFQAKRDRTVAKHAKREAYAHMLSCAKWQSAAQLAVEIEGALRALEDDHG